MHTTPPRPQRKYRHVPPNRIVARFVEEWVELSDLPLSEIGRQIGVHEDALYRVRSGQRGLKLDEALMLLDVLGREPGVLLELRDALRRGSP
jgi:plasmid maintenance system antidote protein VapI